MIKGKQTKLIEDLYRDEIKYLSYEIYEGSDVIPHIRTFAILNDEFETKIKLEDLGQATSKKIEELRINGFKEEDKEKNSLLLKKVS